MQKYRRGQMWWYHPDDESGLPVHAQKGIRPVILVSDDNINATSTCLLGVACTKQYTRNFPTQVMFVGNGIANVARCEQIVRVDVLQLENFICQIEPYVMEFIDIAIKRAFGFVAAFPTPRVLPEVHLEPDPPVTVDIKPIASAIKVDPPAPVIRQEEKKPTTPPASKTLIDNDAGKRRVWDDLSKTQLLDDIENLGVMKTAKKYNLTSGTVQSYAGKFLRDVNGAR